MAKKLFDEVVRFLQPHPVLHKSRRVRQEPLAIGGSGRLDLGDFGSRFGLATGVIREFTQKRFELENTRPDVGRLLARLPGAVSAEHRLAGGVLDVQVGFVRGLADPWTEMLALGLRWTRRGCAVAAAAASGTCLGRGACGAGLRLRHATKGARNGASHVASISS